MVRGTGRRPLELSIPVDTDYPSSPINSASDYPYSPKSSSGASNSLKSRSIASGSGPKSPALGRRHSPLLGPDHTEYAGGYLRSRPTSPRVAGSRFSVLSAQDLAASRRGSGNGGGGTVRPRWRYPRTTRLVMLVVLGIVFIIVVVLRKRNQAVKERITTRWWLPGAVKPPGLAPLPSVLKKPPIRMEPSSSHTAAQLARLETTFSLDTPPRWSALLHVSSLARGSSMSRLVDSLISQSIPPSSIIVNAPSGMESIEDESQSIVSWTFHDDSTAPVLALLNASYTIADPTTLIVLSSSPPLVPSYAETLLRVAATKEYAATVLTTSGIVLPASCISSTEASSTSKTKKIDIPTSPFLIQTSWLPPISNGMRKDVSLEIGITLGLWKRGGIPIYSVPLVLDGSRGREEEAMKCEYLIDELDRRIVVFGQAGGGGLRARVGASSVRGRLREGLSVVKGWLDDDGEEDQEEEDGIVVLLLSGQEELELSRPMACGLASIHDLRIYLADADDGDVYVPPLDSSGSCNLDIHRLSTTPTSDLPVVVIEEFSTLPRIEVVLYLVDGERGREYGEVLKWSAGVFGAASGGGRKSRKEMENERGLVVIGLGRDEVEYAEWIGALPLEALRHWHTPQIDLSVITNNRPASLERLLKALKSAHYFGDQVSLSLNLEQTADRSTQSLVDGFAWPHGTVTLRHRIILGGLMPAIVESWYPASNDSYGVFLEDDVEVSPLFYAWLKFTILQYRYYTPMQERSSRLFGISLYQQKNIETRPEGRQPFDAHRLFDTLSIPSHTPYLSQIPCSWGAVYFPEVWREFHTYLSLRLSETALSISDSIVPEIRSNRWPRSWKKYFIELVYMRGYVMLYPNYPDFLSFSTNHLEKGTHIKVNRVDQKRKLQFQVPLMDHDGDLLDLPDGKLPTWDALPIVDLWGSIATNEELVERGWQSVNQLDTCAKPFRIDVEPSYNARELLCPKVYDRTNVLVVAQPLVGSQLEDASHPHPVERPEIVPHPERENETETSGVRPTSGLMQQIEDESFLREYRRRMRIRLEEQKRREGERDEYDFGTPKDGGGGEGQGDRRIVDDGEDGVGIVRDVPFGEPLREEHRLVL